MEFHAGDRPQVHRGDSKISYARDGDGLAVRWNIIRLDETHRGFHRGGVVHAHENRFARHSAMAKRSQEWAGKKGWKPFAAEGYRSQTMTVVENPPTFDCAALNKFMAPRGIRLANGYGQLKGKTFRIAHMGDMQPADLREFLRVIDELLEKA